MTPDEIATHICRCSTREEYQLGNTPDSAGLPDYSPAEADGPAYSLVWDHSIFSKSPDTLDNPTFTELSQTWANFSILEFDFNASIANVIVWTVTQANTDPDDSTVQAAPYKRTNFHRYRNSLTGSEIYQETPPGTNPTNKSFFFTTGNIDEARRNITFTITATVDGLQAANTLVMTSVPSGFFTSGVYSEVTFTYTVLPTPGDPFPD